MPELNELKSNKDIILFLNNAISTEKLDLSTLDPESASRLKLHLMIKEQAFKLQLKNANISEKDSTKIAKKLKIIGEFTKQTETIKPEFVYMSIQEINAKIGKLTTEKNRLEAEVKKFKAIMDKNRNKHGDENAYIQAESKLRKANQKIAKGQTQIYSYRGMKHVISVQDQQKANSSQREAVGHSTQQQSVVQKTADQKTETQQKVKPLKNHTQKQPRALTENEKKLVNQIIQAELQREGFAKKRDALISTPDVKEIYAEWTRKMGDQRIRADYFYDKLEKSAPDMVKKIEERFANSPHGDLPCPLTPKEIQAQKKLQETQAKLQVAKEKYDKHYGDIIIDSTTDKVTKTRFSDKKPTKPIKSEHHKTAEKELEKVYAKLAPYKKNEKSITGLIVNFFRMSKIRNLHRQKKELERKIEEYKKPEKGILKPSLSEKVQGAHLKQKAQLTKQPDHQKTRSERVQPQPSLVK
ncbi:hypothetical protein [Enterococcus mundtii]|uniref:hypothetical protein n=1 Tax=Enterococcus mundtii TaxID=53346 RepID=UPI002DC0233F|nr:hypothetical protein [Enterococcus mundtii]MEC3942397.1 hypothetical protein [Enterococcus mundtii]